MILASRFRVAFVGSSRRIQVVYRYNLTRSIYRHRQREIGTSSLLYGYNLWLGTGIERRLVVCVEDADRWFNFVCCIAIPVNIYCIESFALLCDVLGGKFLGAALLLFRKWWGWPC